MAEEYDEMENDEMENESNSRSIKWEWIIIGILCIIIVILSIVIAVAYIGKKPVITTYPLGRFYTYEEGMNLDNFVEEMKEKKMDFLIFDPNGIENIQKVTEFKKRGIRTHLMVLNGTQYIFDHEAALAKVKSIVDYVSNNSIEVESFHLYCSPSESEVWGEVESNVSWSVRNETFQQWSELVKKVRLAVPSHIQLSGAISYILDKLSYSGLISGGSARELTRTDMLDILVVEHYGFDTDCLYNLISWCPWEPRLNDQMNQGAKVIFADIESSRNEYNNENTYQENKDKGLYLGTAFIPLDYIINK